MVVVGCNDGSDDSSEVMLVIMVMAVHDSDDSNA
jgi:hypothetical protein